MGTRHLYWIFIGPSFAVGIQFVRLKEDEKRFCLHAPPPWATRLSSEITIHIRAPPDLHIRGPPGPFIITSGCSRAFCCGWHFNSRPLFHFFRNWTLVHRNFRIYRSEAVSTIGEASPKVHMNFYVIHIKMLNKYHNNSLRYILTRP